MARKHRLGIIGFGHMHINGVAPVYAAHPQVEWVACSDTRPICPELRKAPYTREWNQETLAQKLGIARSYADYREMLEREKLDIVIVTTENAQHPEVVEACAAAGVNVCVEKPMAADLSGALRMVRACQAAGTTLLVNWPLTWAPAARLCKQLIDEGAIGRVLEVKYRAGHNGPLGAGVAHSGVKERAGALSGPERGATWWHQEAAGGGVMRDFCCYGAMVARWYIGEPAVAAIGLRANLNSSWGDADDNGVIAIRFPTAMALVEGTWCTPEHGVPTGPIVYGAAGTLVMEKGEGAGAVRLERGDGQRATYDAVALPAGRATVAEEFIHHLETGEPLHPTLEMMNNLEYLAILDAGLRSSVSGRLETVDSAAWCIG